MDSPRVQVRKGQAPDMMDREAFGRQFRHRFFDPAFDREREALGRIEVIAWEAYQQGRKSGRARAAGPGFADPKFELSEEWLATRARLAAAQKRWGEAATPSRVLVVAGASRNDGTCPGEMSKTWRLAQVAREALAGDSGQGGIDVDVLDLSHLASDYAHHIHPCKGCVSTAMPLCHWPCSCYPNHALGQVWDWMNEIYERWVAAHGVLIVAPTYWYQSPSALKLMIDRLVCADGGNPDITTTHGKKSAEAKALEAQGWHYPKHLAGRTYGVVVHGDVAGVESQRRNLCDWLDWMGLIDAGPKARLDRYIGYWQPYHDSHDRLDRNVAVQDEVRQAAQALAEAIGELRAGRLSAPDAGIAPPRRK